MTVSFIIVLLFLLRCSERNYSALTIAIGLDFQILRSSYYNSAIKIYSWLKPDIFYPKDLLSFKSFFSSIFTWMINFSSLYLRLLMMSRKDPNFVPCTVSNNVFSTMDISRISQLYRRWSWHLALKPHLANLYIINRFYYIRRCFCLPQNCVYMQSR